MSKEKSQHFAHGKTLTFLEYDYEVLLVRGCMYGQRRLYFHLRVGGRERMLIGVPPLARAGESWYPDIQMIRQKP